MTEKENALILVADNNNLALNANSEVLKDSGFSVIACENTGRVISMLRDNNVDVVLSDINVPHSSGIALLEAIHKFNPDITVILMTAVADPNIRIDAIKKGAFDFLVKPFDTECLLNTVSKAVEYAGLKEKEKGGIKEFENESPQGINEMINTLMKMEKAEVQRFSKAAEYWINDSLNNEY